MNQPVEEQTRDDVARMMAAKGDSETGKLAIVSITGNNERSRQIAFNKAAEAFMDMESTTEQERALVAQFVRRADNL